MLAHQYALLTRTHTDGMESVLFFFVWVLLASRVLVKRGATRKIFDKHERVLGVLGGYYSVWAPLRGGCLQCGKIIWLLLAPLRPQGTWISGPLPAAKRFLGGRGGDGILWRLLAHE